MGFFSDLFFGTDSSNEANGKKRKSENSWDSFSRDYDDYYSELHQDAMEGDIGAQEEMRDEFGDDWEHEY